jgi:hypothetical protein
MIKVEWDAKLEQGKGELDHSNVYMEIRLIAVAVFNGHNRTVMSWLDIECNE